MWGCLCYLVVSQNILEIYKDGGNEGEVGVTFKKSSAAVVTA